MFFRKQKVHALLTMVAYFLFAAQCVAGDTIAVSRFSLAYNKTSVTLKIEFLTTGARIPVIQDTGKTTLFGNPPRKYSGEDGIQKQLYRLITQNTDLELVTMYPDYIEAIINLVDGEKNKAKARRIYEKENYNFPVNKTSSSSLSYQNGISTSSSQLNYTCTFVVKKETQLLVPEFILNDGVNVYHTRLLVIDLKNNGS